MTSRELVLATLAGRPAPRVPTGPLAVHFCARAAGYTLREYTTCARTLAESILLYYEQFRPDAVWVSADTWVSAEAMGARVGATGVDQPFGGLGEPLVQCPADLARIPPTEVSAQGRYPLMLEALARVKQALRDEVFVVACFDQYPFSLAAALMGLARIMLKVMDDAPFVEALMHRCCEYASAYGRALGGAGADLLSGGDSPAGLLGPARYASVAQPFEERLVRELKRATAKPVSLHLCGDATPYLAGMAATGADVLECDHAVDLAQACRTVGPDVTLWGNLDPVAVLAQGTPEQVRAEARKALAAVHAAGHRRFVLSSGCTLAVDTPARNVTALLGAEEHEGV